MPFLPEVRNKVEYVIDKDGGYTFLNGMNNVKVSLSIRLLDNNSVVRRRRLSDISSWLRGQGNLTTQLEPDIYYEASVMDTSIASTVFFMDTFNVTFDCKPIRKSNYVNSDLTWEEATMIWDTAEIPWEGVEQVFTNVQSSDVLTVWNFGNYVCQPIIKLTGQATEVTLFPDIGNFAATFNNLNGTIYMDTENQLVYSISGPNKVNEISNFEGEFVKLKTGENTITMVITGLVNLDVEFIYRNTYV